MFDNKLINAVAVFDKSVNTNKFDEHNKTTTVALTTSASLTSPSTTSGGKEESLTTRVNDTCEESEKQLQERRVEQGAYPLYGYHIGSGATWC